MSAAGSKQVMYLAPEAILHLAWQRVGLIPEVFIAPGVPARKERNVRRQYGLDPAEEVLVLLDDTAWGGGKDGAVLTSRRLCWREMFGDARQARWWELSPGDIELADTEVRVQGKTISMVLVGDNVRELFVALLREVVSGDLDELGPYRGGRVSGGYRDGPVEQEEMISRRIVALAGERLGAAHNTFTTPDIPARKLAGALAAHGRCLASGEEVLALYDDTLFGSGEDGFCLTSRRLCWKNLTEPPRQVPWLYLPPERILANTLDAVQVGACKIDMMADNDRASRTAGLLREIRALYL